jgi:hypothetical protein
MSKLAIVQRYEGKTIDDAFLHAVGTEHDEYFGFCCVNEGELSLDHRDLEDLPDIKKFMKDNRDACYLGFGKDAGTDNSKQPFSTVQNEGGAPIIAIFIEGDLQGFGKPETSDSIEFAAHQAYLAPKILDIYQDAGEDLDKTYEKLNKAITRDEMITRCFPTPDSRGEILIMFANGKTINIVRGEKHKKFEWGETSMAFAYEVKTEEKPTKVPLGGKRSTVLSLPDKDKKSDTAIAAAMNVAKDNQNNLGIMILPPAHRSATLNDIHSWYNSFCAKEDKPTDEELAKMHKHPENFIAVKVKPQITNKSFNQMLEKGTIKLLDSKSAAPAVVHKEPDIPIAIIGKDSIEKFNKEFAPKLIKAYSDNSSLIVDPARLNEFLKDKPLFTDQIGRQQMGLKEFENLSADGFKLLVEMFAKDDPMVIVAMLEQYRLEVYRLSQRVEQLEKVTLRKAM